MVSPGASFFTFPKNIRTIVMGSSDQEGNKVISSLVARTQDALEVTIECSFQYKIAQDQVEIIALFRDWGENYEDAFIRIARNNLRDTMAKFKAL